MIDLRECRDLLRESGAYTDTELDILDETLAAYSEAPGGAGVLAELRDGKVLAGFALASREEATEFTFSVRAICLGPSYLGTKAAADLLARLEEAVRGNASSSILRVETSSAKSAAFGAASLELAGYFLIGHIPDFYARGNDYFMYAKHLVRAGTPGKP
jgi:hypothetical protein